MSLPLQGYPVSHQRVPMEHGPSQGDRCSPWLEIPWFEPQLVLLMELLMELFSRGTKLPKS